MAIETAPTPAATQRDPGLQPQRTALAWGRTALAMAANALLLLRGGIVGGQRGVVVLAVLLLVGAAAVLHHAARRRQALSGAEPPSAPTGAASAPVPAASVTVHRLLVGWVLLAALGAVVTAL